MSRKRTYAALILALLLALSSVPAYADGEADSSLDAREAAVRAALGESALDNPASYAMDDAGNFYISDAESGVVRKLDSENKLSVYASGLAGPTGLSWNYEQGMLYICETDRSRIVRINNGEIEVVAGVSEPSEDAGEYYGGYADGPIDRAEFDHPQGVLAVGSAVYVADSMNRAVRLIENGKVYTLYRAGDSASDLAVPRGLSIDGSKLVVSDALDGKTVELELETAVYSDVAEGAWYAEPVYELTRRGIVNGIGEGQFTPASNVTRGMFTTMLSRIALSLDGSEIINGEESFPDVPEGTWYEGAARWAKERGVVNGINGNFAQGENITREQIVTMIYRFNEVNGFIVSDKGSSESVAAFTDADSISSWAKDAMYWAAANGIMNGSKGELRPKAPATRAETAKLLNSYMELYGI